MFGVCAWRSVWRGMLWLFVVMGQHNVWCVCVTFCVERYDGIKIIQAFVWNFVRITMTLELRPLGSYCKLLSFTRKLKAVTMVRFPNHVTGRS